MKNRKLQTVFILSCYLKKMQRRPIQTKLTYKLFYPSEKKRLTNHSLGIIVDDFKDRISSLENELKSRDAIIEYPAKQLMSSNSKKSQMKSNKCNLNEAFNDDKSK